MQPKSTPKTLTASKTKTTVTKASNDNYRRFESFAQRLVSVPKKEIDEQEKIYQVNKEKKG
ncbi:MAG: hypothetical protein H0T08_08005 [Acidobacteria bacterium]|jgi:hypothetical protein|nr:hypothetical protein [Acidobacteriota bacterium]